MAVTLSDIAKDMGKFRNPTSNTKRNPKDDPNVSIKNTEVEASFGIKSVLHKAIAIGSDQNYVVGVQFFFDEPLSREPIKGYVEAEDEKQGIFYYPQADYKNTRIKVHCGCRDFRFRWSIYLEKALGLIITLGKTRKYTKVPGSTRPSVNPNKTMGVCKHLTNYIDALAKDGVIKSIPPFIKK